MTDQKEIETPLTDAAKFMNCVAPVPLFAVDVDFARQLERDRKVLYEVLKKVLPNLDENEQPYEGTHLSSELEDEIANAIALIESGEKK